jgi:hypothetical protein
MDGAVAQSIPPSYHATRTLFCWLWWGFYLRPLILAFFEGVPGRIASGVFFIEVSLALVGVASPAYFQ